MCTFLEVKDLCVWLYTSLSKLEFKFIENHFMLKKNCDVLKLLIVYKFPWMRTGVTHLCTQTRSLKLFSEGG